jgi:hypothetical protein
MFDRGEQLFLVRENFSSFFDLIEAEEEIQNTKV